MSGGQFGAPMVFRGPNGQAGQLAATHSQSFEAMYSHWPGLKVVTPSNPYDAKGLLKSAIRDNDPVVFMESERMYGDVGEIPEGEYLIPLAELEKEGVNAEVIDLRTIRPLDIDTIIASVKKTNRLIIVEESHPVSSVSSEVAYRVQRHAFDYLDAPIRRLCMADAPFAFSIPLIEESLPQIKDVVQAAKDVAYVG
ncbi:UNVERIFIED_CONTAM: hypothetical protein GTU68_024223 [Idotea baltica]|nr:hypothetical protein [Idotea baltica]